MQTWVDERLFGWSKTSRRSWDDGSSSRGTSRSTTPHGSDDEDSGDWDHVSGWLSAFQGDKPSGQPQSRSRSTSYADLQQARASKATES
jgi:glycerol-3-phosphate O-acyltransferase/dihydroxyacetone phosphate acyltransferase